MKRVFAALLLLIMLLSAALAEDAPLTAALLSDAPLGAAPGGAGMTFSESAVKAGTEVAVYGREDDYALIRYRQEKFGWCTGYIPLTALPEMALPALVWQNTPVFPLSGALALQGDWAATSVSDLTGKEPAPFTLLAVHGTMAYVEAPNYRGTVLRGFLPMDRLTTEMPEKVLTLAEIAPGAPLGLLSEASVPLPYDQRIIHPVIPVEGGYFVPYEARKDGRLNTLHAALVDGAGQVLSSVNLGTRLSSAQSHLQWVQTDGGFTFLWYDDESCATGKRTPIALQGGKLAKGATEPIAQAEGGESPAALTLADCLYPLPKIKAELTLLHQDAAGAYLTAKADGVMLMRLSPDGTLTKLNELPDSAIYAEAAEGELTLLIFTHDYKLLIHRYQLP